MQYDLIIVGGGAAGLMAAAHAEKLNVLLIEKNHQVGKKVMISGKGQCNFTHDATATEMSHYFGSHRNFVKHALAKWSPDKTREWFMNRDVPSVVMENGKVFPKSMKAEDVVQTMLNEAVESGVNIHLNESVESIKKLENDEVFTVSTNKDTYKTFNVLIATGGFTYSVTGSDGDGYRFAKAMGHLVIEPHAALAPIYHEVEWLKALAGVSIPQAAIGHWRSGKRLSELKGDLLFTHKGLSGPVILNNSRDFRAEDELRINFSSVKTEEFEKALISEATLNGKGMVKTFIRQACFSRSMADHLIHALQMADDLRFADMDKKMRTEIVRNVTSLSVPIQAVGGRKIGMVTAGGIALEEVKAKTLESKIHQGLYFAGEVLDVDGDTGGYNIQWAFSSAIVAVNDIVSKMG